MSLLDAVIVLANLLSLSISTGLIFVMVIQPRFSAINGWFAVFLASLSLWAAFAMARHTPQISPFSETHNFYAQFLGLSLTPVTLYIFVIVLCDIKNRLSLSLAAWGGIALVILAVMLWSGDVVVYRETGGSKLDFDLLAPGYIALAHVIVYSLLSYLYLYFSENPQSQPLRLPAMLLLIGYGSLLVPDLRPLPLDISLTTVAAMLIGYAVLRWQLFNPLSETNQQLSALNTELRLAITDLAVEKERTERLNQDLRDASDYKSEFLANMSHELRTPLNSIVGYSELLLKGIYGLLSEKQEDRVEKIHRNGLNLLALINDILDLSKIEGGRLELNLTPVRLAPLAESLQETIEPLALAKALDFQIDLEKPLRLIHADELRIRQALLNLLGNAIKFTPHGYVRLTARNITVKNGQSAEFPLPVIGWLEDRAWLLVSVQDSGIGIPSEDQASIFDEFRQVNGGATRQYEGVGLGLAITKKLIELHTGRIWVQSQPGKGSTFYAALPALDQFDSPPVPVNEMQPLVLVVEDNDEAAAILSGMLHKQSLRVVRAQDEASGLARVHEARPDAILVDILMPSLYGWNIIRRLKDDPATAGIPILIVSVLDNQPSGFLLGTSACIHKPIHRDDLLTALTQVQHVAIERPVLVVDDNPSDRDLLTAFLATESITPELTADGPEALRWLRASDAVPGLVLVDLVMPEVNGFEILQALRSDARWRDVPVVVLCPNHLTEADHTTLNDHIARVIQSGDPGQGSLLANLEAVLS